VFTNRREHASTASSSNVGFLENDRGEYAQADDVANACLPTSRLMFCSHVQMKTSVSEQGTPGGIVRSVAARNTDRRITTIVLPWKSRATFLLGAYALLFSEGKSAAFGQPSGSSPVARISGANAVSLIVVNVELETQQTSLVVACCGETPYGTPILCSRYARLEVETPTGWIPPKAREGIGSILVDEPTKRVRTFPIISGSARSLRSLVVEFPPEFFDMSAVHQLRVVVDAWPDAQSMLSGRKPTQLVSPPFHRP